jgi:ComF family protein
VHLEAGLSLARGIASAGVWVRHGLEAFLCLVYPEVCALCRKNPAGVKEGFVCGLCRSSVLRVLPPFCERCGLPPSGKVSSQHACAHCRDARPPFESARADLVAKGPVLEVLHRFKYRGELWFEPFLRDALLSAAVPALSPDSWAGLVPVPLHPVKEREREFNQAEILGRPLARALGIPMERRLVRRSLPTVTQTRLSREERAENMRDAFQPHPSARRIQGDWIVVDDVFTTGATSGAVARVLLGLGARKVVVWSVARAALEGGLLPQENSESIGG